MFDVPSLSERQHTGPLNIVAKLINFIVSYKIIPVFFPIYYDFPFENTAVACPDRGVLSLRKKRHTRP